MIIKLGLVESIIRNCDKRVKESDSYQDGINLNISNEKVSRKFELLQHTNIFTINPSTGILRTTRTFDRESLCQPNHNCECSQSICLLEITIFATNPTKYNQPPERIYKTICIDDINDNKPTFPESTQTLDLNEKSSIGTILELHSAHDMDSVNFSVTKYSIKCSVSIFNLSYSIMRENEYKLDHQVKLIVNHNVSFQQDPVKCSLSACDVESCSSMGIVIRIIDINDNSPEWESLRYYIKIKENIGLDTVIQTFQASDSDTVFGKISYSIGKIMLQDIHKSFLSNIFTIDSMSGDLKVNGNIDYEDRTNRRFVMTIIAKDNGTPSLSSSTTVTIDVEDINDNNPQINLNKVLIDVEENSNLNYLDYFTVIDSDEEANGNIECDILESSDYFRLRRSNSNLPVTYEIYLKRSLDHEKQAIHAIVIQCQDGGKPNLTSIKRITINVIDVNDNSVYFPQKLIYIPIAENTPVGSEIMKILAIDSDKKSDLIYSFVNPNNCSYVNIDSYLGYITTNEIFDRELKDEFIFFIRVVEKDNSNFTDVANVIIRIMDINDNAPIFNDFYTFSVPENASIDGYIGSVHASDKDLGENGTVWYSQAPQMTNHPIYFTVSNNGEIRLFYKLDFEKKGMHQIIVIARDQGLPQALSTSTTVIVTVLDSNNNPPKFEESFYTLSLTCQTQIIDRNLFPVHDKDTSLENKIMNYQLEIIKPLQYKQVFSIDKVTGIITMTIKKEQCDFKLRDKEKIEIKLLVYDPTKPEFRDKTNLHLYLENERYQKNLIENKNRHNQGPIDLSIKKNFKVSYPEPENSFKSEEFVDQNITIIMVLIFVTIFLGIFLISIVCFVKKKKIPDVGQDIEENTIMVTEKMNPSIQSSRSEYNEHPVNNYIMPLKKMMGNTIHYPTMTDNLRTKNQKHNITSGTSVISGMEEQFDKHYEIATKPNDNNTYQSLTMNSKFSNLEPDFSDNNSFPSSTNNVSQNKNINFMQHHSLTNQPNNKSYISVSFV